MIPKCHPKPHPPLHHRWNSLVHQPTTPPGAKVRRAHRCCFWPWPGPGFWLDESADCGGRGQPERLLWHLVWKECMEEGLLWHLMVPPWMERVERLWWHLLHASAKLKATGKKKPAILLLQKEIWSNPWQFLVFVRNDEWWIFIPLLMCWLLKQPPKQWTVEDKLQNRMQFLL